MAFQAFKPADTAGALFNRKEPRNAQGDTVPILNRRLEVRKDVQNHVFNGGKDFTSLGDRHKFKYRIPDDSVVNKVADFKLFCCFGYRMTSAQYIWILNLICFLAHTAMVFVVAYFSWWKKDMEKLYGNDNPYEITIYRISANWTNETTQGYEFHLEDNGMPIDIAWATLAFFAISAVFHLFAVIVGLWEHTWFWYWRQIDDCFCFWRWIEYSGSASLMGMLLAISIGIREQNTVRLALPNPIPFLPTTRGTDLAATAHASPLPLARSQLACIFMLLWTTMFLGLFTELYSRPSIYIDKKNYSWPVGRLGYVDTVDYTRNPNALHLLSQSSWEGDRQLRDEDGKALTVRPDYLVAQRTSNYIRRMLPHVLGTFTFTTVLVILIYHLEFQKWQLRQNRPDLEMPNWVNNLLYGTFVIFSSFSAVQVIFQYLPPAYYWGSEISYCILSLTAKLYLGVFLLVNVLMIEARAEDSLGGAALQPSR